MDLLVSFLTGLLSAFGVGGGSLLLIYLSQVAGFSQSAAQGINLLYFLPAATAALPSHHKNGRLLMRCIVPAVCGGLVTAALFAWLSNRIDTELLRHLFGVFLAIVGIKELVASKSPSTEAE